MNKVILVVLDGLNADVAFESMGFLHALCEKKLGKAYRLTSELPSLSRPLYECILTGVTPVDSGIYHNGIVRLSKEQSIFHYVRSAGLKTAAAAYHWVSELYNKSPFEASIDRHTADETLAIQYGHFYYHDDYPDSHLFDDAEHLLQKYQPDFLLIHPMNIDNAGHCAGLDSSLYRNTVRNTDVYLSAYIAKWIKEGYQIVVTSDHGMNNDKSHGGTLASERDVPFFAYGNQFSFEDAIIKQTEICGTICDLLGVEHDKSVNKRLLKHEQ